MDFSVAFEGIARAWGARSLNSAYLVLTAWRLVGAALAVWLLGVMLPFYGTINSFMGAIGVPTTAFLLPAAAFTWHFRKREARDAAVFPPHR